MRKILRFSLIFTFVLITANQILGNLHFAAPPVTVIKIALIMALFEIIIKPILKILLLPINLLTLGLFRIIIDTLGLYLATFLLTDFEVRNISLTTPSLHLSGFTAYLATSIVISLTFNLFRSLLTKTVKK